jgi:hypothetical protein
MKFPQRSDGSWERYPWCGKGEPRKVSEDAPDNFTKEKKTYLETLLVNHTTASASITRTPRYM